MSELNGKVPMLGEQKIRATPQMLVSLIRHLEDDGTFEPESTQLNNGQVQAVAGRSNITSAEDLVEMLADELMPRLRDMLKQELAALKGD